MRRPLLLALPLLAAAAPAARAQAPANDARAAAAPLPLGTAVAGDTTGATLEPGEAPPSCAPEAGAAGSLWYRSEPTTVPVVLELDTGGRSLAVDTFDGGALGASGCSRPPAFPGAPVVGASPAGTWVRVVPLGAPGPFTIRAALEATGDGGPVRPLPAAGADGVVDRVRDAADRWSVDLRAGVRYRVRLQRRDRDCPVLTLQGPDGTDDPGTLQPLVCRGFALLRPDRSGRHVLRVAPPPLGAGPQRYRLALERSTADDAGSRALPERRTRRGTVGAAADLRDRYRFRVRRAARVRLRLTTADGAAAELRLYRGNRRVACACAGTGSRALTADLRPGTYHVVVRAEGFAVARYALRRSTRPR